MPPPPGSSAAGCSRTCLGRAASSDGRYAVFESAAPDLVPEDTNRSIDVFVRDRVLGTTIRASTAADGTQGDGDSLAPALSADGRRVAFVSLASNLVPGDTNRRMDVFVKDLQTGQITRTSMTSAGGQIYTDGAIGSHAPFLSADGSRVAFVCSAPLLPSDDVPYDFFDKIYVFDLTTSTLYRADTTASGAGTMGDGAHPSLSADGNLVLFDHYGALVAGDTNDTGDAYVKDLRTGAVARVSTSTSGAQAAGTSLADHLSSDGRYVVFTSWAGNLVAGDTNGLPDVFLKDRQTGTTTRLSTASDGTQATQESSGGIFLDGGSVVFGSESPNLAPGLSLKYDRLFRKDLSTGETTFLARGTSPSPAPDGSLLVFTSDDPGLLPLDVNGLDDVVALELGTGTVSPVSVRDPTSDIPISGAGASYSYPVSLSADGDSVAFSSKVATLAEGDTNQVEDVFVRHLGTATTIRVSTPAGGGEGNDMSWAPSISGDGVLVAFVSRATNLVEGDTEVNADVFVKHLTTGEIIRASAPPGGGAPDSVAIQRCSLSRDGSRVAFDSFSSNLVPGDTNASWDVFVTDLEANTISRVSTGPDGTQANASSVEPSISADGRWVAFESTASNLVPGDTGRRDIFVKDLSTGEVLRASESAAGGTANGDSRDPAISADGRWVIFVSAASDLVASDGNGADDVFLRDVLTGTTVRVTTDDDLFQAYIQSASEPVVSDDGLHAAFTAVTLGLDEADPYADPDVFVKDLDTGYLTRVSVGNTRTGYPAVSSGRPSLDASGDRLVFTSTDTGLADGDANGAEDVFLARREADISLANEPAGVAVAGAILPLRIAFRNNGPFPAVAPVVAFAFPPDTTDMEGWAERPGWTVSAPPSAAAGEVVFTRPVSPSVTTLTEMVGRGRLAPDLPEGSAVSVTVTGTSDTPDPRPSDNALTRTWTVTTRADLTVTLVGPPEAIPGGEIVWTVSVANSGPSDARQVTLDLALPEGLTPVSQRQTAGPAFTLAVGEIHDTLDRFPAASTATIEVVCRVGETLEDGALLTATATVSATTPDLAPENDLATSATVVSGRADLVVGLTLPPAVVAGASVVFNLTLANEGPSDAPNVTLTVDLPTELSLLSQRQVSGPSISLGTDSSGILDAIALLPTGEQVEIEVTAVLDPSAADGETLTLRAQAASSLADPDPTDDAAEASCPVLARADVAVFLSTPPAATVCGPVEAGITLVNAGPSNARGTALSMALSPETSPVSFSQVSGPAAAIGEGGAVIPVLPAGSSAVFTLILDVAPSTPAGTVLEIGASADSETIDPTPGGGGESSSSLVVWNPANRPPAAVAGGPYTVVPGRGMILDGTGSIDPDVDCGDTVTSWEWDVDGDGEFDDGIGPTVGYDHELVGQILCGGGTCAEGSSRTVYLRVTDGKGESDTAPAAVEFPPPLFRDFFDHPGLASDPDWVVRSGRWRLRKDVLVSREDADNRAVLDDLAEPVGAAAIRLVVRLPLNRFLKRPNATVAFAWQNRTAFRYVKLTPRGITLGQVGEMGGESPGRWFTPLPIRPGVWHGVHLEIGPDGWVGVFLDGSLEPAAGHSFSETIPGAIALRAVRSQSRVDDFEVWPP